jgi:hypothetical protein
MEYCEAGDLYTKINRQRGRLLPENVILHYFVQLCKAVQVGITPEAANVITDSVVIWLMRLS